MSKCNYPNLMKKNKENNNNSNYYRHRSNFINIISKVIEYLLSRENKVENY